MNKEPQATAGTLESNDIFIAISKGESDRNSVFLESIVMKQFGPAIRAVIEESLQEAGLSGVRVEARDKGALDCTIRARVECAAARYKELLP